MSYSNYNSNSNNLNNNLCNDCLVTHDQRYSRNYIWLDELGHGPVQLVWFAEPADSNEYTLYNSKWWETHCKVVSHGRNLFDTHYDTFVNPKTRFARMIFLFADKSLIEADEEFYRLEQEYYNNNFLFQSVENV